MSQTIHIAPEESATTTVIEAIADETGRDPRDLPTLYRVVDPDALNRLAEGPRTGRDPNVTVTFAVAGCRVEVTDTGAVTVEDDPDFDVPSETARTETARTEPAAVESGDSGAVESSGGEVAFEGTR
ncbi:HalOD1 output domain-containing protein [Halorussus lipolyticus]|uniref:HalOD1 output domain-containing protein n=1 Tax=Halorussus lipolyticus TaxID=3034024 RepID=UPI0023E85D11|nr:HalOD1 output domain-containing protein [Halorussus sp. DT80]